MLIEALYAKLHRVRVTRLDRDYMGSLTIGRDLAEAAGVHAGQKVLVANLNNGQRFETYLMLSETKGEVVLNGAAALLGEVGDPVIAMFFAFFRPDELGRHRPRIVLVDDNNRVIEVKRG